MASVYMRAGKHASVRLLAINPSKHPSNYGQLNNNNDEKKLYKSYIEG